MNATRTTHTPRRRLLPGLCLLCLLTCFSQDALGQRRRAPRPAAPAQTTPAQPAAQVTKDPPQAFDTLAAEANAAREGDRLDEALDKYRRALALRPQWAEGWWYLATIHYDRDDYAEAARSFKEAARLQPKAGAAWAMLGICEFQLARYDDALIHIQQGRQVGVNDNVELTRVMRYHEGLLSILKGEFERGQQTLGTLSYEGLKSEDLIIALGLATLRVGMTPKQVDINYRDRDLIRRAGLAEHFAAQKNMSDAQREYDLLARDYGKVANVQYAYGRYLLANRDEDGALAAFMKELENWPKHVLARCQIANIKLQRKEVEEGLRYAEEAARQAPRLPLAHYLLGRLLLEAGQNERAVEALETTAKMVPNEAKTYFALARAYTRLKRKADADRARETFTRLSKAASQGDEQGLGAVPDESAAPGKPPER
ncbi:MAG TPA: tetratricopeptide repeat protein [Pyrinomonadaceae bacterium]